MGSVVFNFYPLIFFFRMTTSYSQSTLQRIRSLKTMRDAKISYLLNIPVVAFYGLSLITMGVVTFAYFSYKRCDPYKVDGSVHLLLLLHLKILKLDIHAHMHLVIHYIHSLTLNGVFTCLFRVD